MKAKTQKAKIAVFASGEGTNLQALIDAQKSGKIKSGEIALVISNNAAAFALKRAESFSIPFYALTVKERSAFEKVVLEMLTAYKIDMIVLGGFMRVLSGDFVKRFPDRIVNVHPSLMPLFCGKGFYGLKVHEEVLKSGVKTTGATVHFVNEITDGGEIISQKAVRVKKNDTPQSLQQRVKEQAEWVILPQAVEKICKNIIRAKQMKELKNYLLANPYHGRGIIVGKIGGQAVAAYFIMGRSENSRNRVFKQEGEDVVIYPFDAEKLGDTSLIIYKPIKRLGDVLIVANGDQTDTICDYMEKETDLAFEKALGTRTFEPDAPNFTPRISALLDFQSGFYYKMSLIKSDGKGQSCRRFTYFYESAEGNAHFVHTYREGNPLLSFCGEPKEFEIKGSIEEFTRTLWDCLDKDNKISLAVKFIDLQTKKTQTKIINKNTL